jgi:hypothetical protein
MRVLVVLILALALTGCALYDPPEKPMKLASEMSPQEWCVEALMLFENPYLDVDTKQAVLEEMKSRRCSAPNLQLPAGRNTGQIKLRGRRLIGMHLPTAPA